MPEGPEVESVRRSLAPHLLGSRILAVTLRRRDIVTTPNDTSRDNAHCRPRPVPRADLLLDQTIIALERRGKQLAIIADSGRVLLVHLGMTGKLIVDHTNITSNHSASPNSSSNASASNKPHRSQSTPHTHAQWTLTRPNTTATGEATDQLRLRFIDPRRFGGLWTLPSPDALAHRWQHLGPDASLIDADSLTAPFSRRSAPIKAMLLDQSIVAGVGNIYADESLFAARLNPLAPASSLSPAQLETLADSIRAIIHAAINAGGSTIRDYADSNGNSGTAQLAHQVYARAALPCTRCATPLATATVAQRTTVWCPACQPRQGSSEPRA